MPDVMASPTGFATIAEQTIYVVCPARLVTGGTELLHQLVGHLVAGGRNASIIYTPWDGEWSTPEEFKRYGCPVAREPVDESEVAVIVPEVSTEHLARFRRARRVVWWLSVTNYRGGFADRHQFLHYVRRWIFPDIPPGATHLFQSAYAKDFVGKRFRRTGAMLTDYLADEYVAGSPPLSDCSRSNIVAFNPRKGWNYTSKLIKAFPGIRFMALEGMDRVQMKAALDTCKVYIDFGDHPGKDRLPREAAVRGAVVIVGKRGSARYIEDVPLPESYKVDARELSVDSVGRMIQDAMDRFDWHQAQQLSYRTAILNERAAFQRQADEVFGLDPTRSRP